ncbi:MAG: TraB/GumN family protein [Halieaceae bacterium]
MLKKLLCFTLLAISLQSQAAGERLLIWETSTAGSQVYLLGSMHLARADIYPLRREIMQAFEGADKLVVELDISGAGQLAIQQRMLERGAYPAGRSIRDDLSPATWQALSQQLQASGLPPFLMESMKPGLVITTLSTFEMMKLGLDPEQGIDRYFLRLARGQKPILELETVDEQLNVLLDFPQPDLLVRQTLGQLDQLESIMAQLLDSWKRGDAAALNKLVIEDELAEHPEYRELQRRMFDDRNRAMTDKILALQQAGGRYFVVVGAGHLVGNRGIIALLQQQGQRPRQL